jgi:hypothetical protein
MRDIYIDRLVKFDNSRFSGGYCHINDQIKGLVIEDVNEVSFNNLYASLLIYFHKNGVLDKFDIKIDSDVINRLIYYFDNKLVKGYPANKTWINALYGGELRGHANVLIGLYSQYMQMYYEDIIRDNSFNWLYIDTDVMYFIDKEVASNLQDIPACSKDIFDHKYAVFEEKKKLILTDNLGGFKVKGYFGRQTNKKDEIINKIKTHIRNGKLDQLGI